MKKIILIFTILFSFLSCGQNNSAKYGNQSFTPTKVDPKNSNNFSGEFNGVFTDLKKGKGSIDLFYFQTLQLYNFTFTTTK